MGSGWGLNRWGDRALYCHKSSTGGREQVLLICDDAHHFAKKCLLLGFLRARNLLLLIFRLLPTGIGVEFLHGSGWGIARDPGKTRPTAAHESKPGLPGPTLLHHTL